MKVKACSFKNKNISCHLFIKRFNFAFNQKERYKSNEVHVLSLKNATRAK